MGAVLGLAAVGAGVGAVAHELALNHAERGLQARAALVVSDLTAEQLGTAEFTRMSAARAAAARLDASVRAAGLRSALVRSRDGAVLLRTGGSAQPLGSVRTVTVALPRIAATAELTADAGPMLRSAQRTAILAGGLAATALALLAAIVLVLLRRTRRLVSRAEDEALTDHLTALPTRALFDDRLGRACVQAARDGAQLALMVIDLDQFKPINDKYGHGVGDAVLREVACRLVGSVREADTVARLGGDEFGVVLRGLGGNEVRATAMRIQTALDREFHVGDVHIALDASIGIAVYPDNGHTREELVHHADAAMYAAKHAGLQYAFAEAGGSLLDRERERLRSELADGVTRGELLLHYQPRVELATGETSSFEALLRWLHPTRGLLPARAFVSAADPELARRIYASALESSLAQAALWHRDEIDAAIAVNIDAASLRDPAFAQRLANLLDRNDLDPARVEVDIPFAGIGADVDAVVKTAHELARAGIVLALDDFAGNRFTPSVIGALPISRLNLDASLVATGAVSRAEGSLLAATVAFAHRLGLTVAAKGVEDAAILAFARELGVDHVQGYHVGRPLDPHAVVVPAALGSAA